MKKTKDWLSMVWNAKEKIYKEMEGLSFRDYMDVIERRANAFLTRHGLDEKKQKLKKAA